MKQFRDKAFVSLVPHLLEENADDFFLRRQHDTCESHSGFMHGSNPPTYFETEPHFVQTVVVMTTRSLQPERNLIIGATTCRGGAQKLRLSETAPAFLLKVRVCEPKIQITLVELARHEKSCDELDATNS